MSRRAFRDGSLIALFLAWWALPFLSEFSVSGLLLQSLPTGLYLTILGVLALIISARYLPRFVAVVASVSVMVGAAIVLVGLPYWGPANTAVPSADTINVVTWNTQYWDQSEGLDALGLALAELEADVILLQEHLYKDPDGNGTKAIDRAGVLRDCCAFSEIWSSGELVIAARQAGQAVETSDPNIFAVEIEGITFASIHLPVHVNLRTSMFSSAFWEFTRGSAVLRKRTLAATSKLLDQQEHVVLGGDLNATLLMPKIRVLSERLNFRAWPATWPNGAMLTLWRLDNLGDTRSALRDCAVINIAPEMSDHKPIRCVMDRPTTW